VICVIPAAIALVVIPWEARIGEHSDCPLTAAACQTASFQPFNKVPLNALDASNRSSFHYANRPALDEDIVRFVNYLAEALTESTLLDYVRFQSAQQPPFAGSTINQRVAVADRALRATFPDAPRQVAPEFQVSYWRRAPMGLGRPLPAVSRLRVREPKRTIVPLSIDDVARFWASFHTSRDLAIVGLMLLQGLRSQEVRDLNRDDLRLPEAEIRVPGKGNKPRFLPLAPEAIQLLDHYLRLERPTIAANALFVSLKGPARGARMTPAGLRSLFRHHRQTTGVKIANPHRFRHTFASDMVRAGVSLPALMQLMGHAQIQTTLIYMQVTPLEVYQQYARAVAQLIRPVPVTPA
jgi:integrase